MCDWGYAVSRDGSHFEKKGKIGNLGHVEDATWWMTKPRASIACFTGWRPGGLGPGDEGPRAAVRPVRGAVEKRNGTIFPMPRA